MKRVCTLLLAVAVCLVSIQSQLFAADNEKSALRVLYVGPDPNDEHEAPRYITGDDARRYAELSKERMPAFRNFLEQHFETVKQVNAKDYLAEMSGDYDVTIFDAMVPTVAEGEENWQKQRLPEDFTHAALFVGEVGPLTLGRMGMGLQIDHL